MTEEQLGTILQEYAQADNSTAANYGGTGLGLTITTSLIQMMGGYLDVESEYGVGTKFTINVPRYIQEVAKALDRAAAKINSAAKLLTKIQ